MLVIRFILGLAVGSFLNVVSMRYDPDRSLFDRRVIGGRSHCPHCGRTLRWFELVPVVAYFALNGRCRTCRKKISFQYPLVELLTACIFAFLAPLLRASGNPLFVSHFAPLAAIWTAVLVLLLLMALIDKRLQIIPDEINVLLILLGAARIVLEQPGLWAGDAFTSRFALLFGFTGNIWLNHAAAALFGGLFFGLLVWATRGRGMGLGDVKLALALGFLYGWPDILFITVFAFVSGAVFGLWKISLGKGRLKSAVPFGPFLALGCLIVMLWGNDILSWYFGLFGIVS
jgi:leader peptidase (prepilin peptidase)/N-methyltransferase